MALTLLLDRWCRAQGHDLLAMVVDHGLRSEASAEAERVSTMLSSRGIPNEILYWSGGKPATGIQAAARNARLRLLTERANEIGAAALLLAHHIEDQAETMTMRLERDSGLDGLAGIRARQMRAGVPIIRPLLGCDPRRLKATCLAMAQTWVEDPSNRDRRFERVRVREEADARASVELGAPRLHRIALAFGRLRDWSESTLSLFLSENAALDPRGYVSIDATVVEELPEPLLAKLFSGLIHAIGGADYPPRRESLQRLLDKLHDGAAFPPSTLGGCLFWSDGRKLRLGREATRDEKRVIVMPDSALRWDSRFDVVWHGEKPIWLHMLSDRRYRRFQVQSALTGRIRLPAAFRSSLPAVTSLDGRLEAPHLPETGTSKWTLDDGLLRIDFRPSVPWVADAFRASGDDRTAAKD